MALFWSLQGIEEVQSGTPTFTNVATNSTGHAGIDLANFTSADGGFAWGDINQDGCLDLVINTNSKSPGTRVLVSDCDATNPRFSDETSSLCSGCESSGRRDNVERSVVLADLNNDGYVDLVANGNALIEIYENSGPPNYAFGTTAMTITSISGGMNVEGVFAADYDNDGWLDLILENHNYGIDLYANPRDGSLNFSYVDPSTVGLPTSARDGDYGTAADYDNDGDIDIMARKNDAADLYPNLGGTFGTGVEIDDANNGNKGGVLFADFDNDGDADLFWTDEGTNQIWLYDGSAYVATAKSGDGEPWASAGISAPTSGLDGCAAGDIDNDGWIDIYLTDDAGNGYLFLNKSTAGGSLSFTRDNAGITQASNGEGCSFADYDQDGDLDLYIILRSSTNQLWRNDLNDGGANDYLFVEPRIDLGGGSWRSAIGATVVLLDCDGDVISGIREVPTVSGHGTDAPDVVHFGLQEGAHYVYRARVMFVTKNGIRDTVEMQIVPDQLAGQRLVVYDTDASSTTACDGGVLPVTLAGFQAERQGASVELSWTTVQEHQSDYFEVQRSVGSEGFQPVGQVPAAGTSHTRKAYQFIDEEALTPDVEEIRYRLRQVDIDGQEAYSNIAVLAWGAASAADLRLTFGPNPTVNTLKLRWIPMHENQPVEVSISNLQGQILQKTRVASQAGRLELSLQELPAGTYLLGWKGGGQHLIRKIVKN